MTQAFCAPQSFMRRKRWFVSKSGLKRINKKKAIRRQRRRQQMRSR